MIREAYLNGRWVADEGLAVPVGDPGFAMGVTVTERLRTFDGRVWRQEEHVARLRRSCEIVGVDTAVADELDAAITEFTRRHEPLRQSAATGETPSDWSITVFATPGVGGEPTRCVHGFPLPFNDWAHQYTNGVALRTSAHRQVPAACWPAELKCRSRMHYHLADREAAVIEPGARALLLDTDGFVGETSIANLIAYRDGEGAVSPRTDKVLPGVSLAVVRELANAAGVAFTERDLTVEEVAAADEVWLTNSLSCLLPAVQIDGRPIGSGQPGPGYARMLAAWVGAAGLDFADQARRHSAV